jgi:hypothetical protein
MRWVIIRLIFIRTMEVNMSCKACKDALIQRKKLRREKLVKKLGNKPIKGTYKGVNDDRPK